MRESVGRHGFLYRLDEGRQAIARTAADTLKKVSLELGGKSAHIVCADSDLVNAAERVVAGVTRNAGQACVSGSRLLVERKIAGSFVEAVTDAMRKIVVGDPMKTATNMGPLIGEDQYKRVRSYVEGGVQAGAKMWNREPWRGEGPAGSLRPANNIHEGEC